MTIPPKRRGRPPLPPELRKPRQKRPRKASERGKALPPTPEQTASARALLTAVAALLGYPLVVGKPAHGAWRAIGDAAELPKSYAVVGLSRIWSGGARMPEGIEERIRGLSRDPR